MSNSLLSCGSVTILVLVCLAGLAADLPTVSRPAAPERTRQPTPRPEAKDRSLDLLALVDLKRDRVTGGWSFQPGGLWMSGGHHPKLAFPIVPKVSYELDVDFTMKAGFQFGIALPLNSGRTLLWVTAAHKGGKDSISLGKYHDAPPYSVKKIPSRRLVGSRKYMTIRVESHGAKTQIAAIVDDGTVLDWSGPKDSLTVNPDYKFPNESIGLTNWGTTVLFHTLDLRILPSDTSRT